MYRSNQLYCWHHYIDFDHRLEFDHFLNSFKKVTAIGNYTIDLDAPAVITFDYFREFLNKVRCLISSKCLTFLVVPNPEFSCYYR